MKRQHTYSKMDIYFLINLKISLFNIHLISGIYSYFGFRNSVKTVADTGSPFSPLTCHRTGEGELGSTLVRPDQSLDRAGSAVCHLLSLHGRGLPSPEGRAVLPLPFRCPGVTGPWQAPWALLCSSSGPWPASLGAVLEHHISLAGGVCPPAALATV